jgi:hypothetical protein
MARSISPLGAVLAGMISGASGTLAMDAVWYRRYRRDGGKEGFKDWELSTEATSWEDAGAPAKVGKRFVEGFLRQDVPEEKAGLVNSVVHWSTGIGWGAVFGVLAGSLPKRRVRHGLLFAPVVWATPYLLLSRTGIYKPMSEYDPNTLWQDFSAHLAYGAGLGAAFSLLARAFGSSG